MKTINKNYGVLIYTETDDTLVDGMTIEELKNALNNPEPNTHLVPVCLENGEIREMTHNEVLHTY